MASASSDHGSCRVTFTQTLPAPPLRSYISGYQYVEIDGPRGSEIVDYAYPGWANLRLLFEGEPWDVSIGDASYAPAPRHALFGPLSRAARIVSRAPSKRIAAGITPLGWATLFRADACRYADRLTPAASVFGDRVAATAAALTKRPGAPLAFGELDALFMPLLERAEPPSVEVLRMHDLLMSDEVIEAAEFADRMGLSTRHAARLSAEVFGFPPKLLLRRRRFLRTLDALRGAGPEPWRLRLDPTYHDQAQFSRDFRAFMGMSPTEFFARPRPVMEASHRARAAVLGVGIQGLQPPIR